MKETLCIKYTIINKNNYVIALATALRYGTENKVVLLKLSPFPHKIQFTNIVV